MTPWHKIPTYAHALILGTLADGAVGGLKFAERMAAWRERRRRVEVAAFARVVRGEAA